MSKKQSRLLMQQKLALGSLITLVAGILIYFTIIIETTGPAGAFVEGEHYFLLDTPRRIHTDKIEIMEFFSYGCIHCFNFDDELTEWVQTNETRINFVRNPLVANESWRILGQAYYTMEELGDLNVNHNKLFQELHVARRVLSSGMALAGFLTNNAESKATFISTFNSSSVTAKVNRADALARRFKISSVPNIVVNGKYLVKATRDITFSGMLEVMDFLVQKELQSRQNSS
ncbi:MAG: thiol:disulfide interchange protein DsbA/DsbL [Pseudomonadales bacterium]|nr:thiol:disulfide interchange protein DsbA/DsbL [Pseudomonadales bacterium]